MKAIVIKLNNKVVFCESLKDLTISQFNDLHKEAVKTIFEKDRKIGDLEKLLAKAQTDIQTLFDKCNDLQHQIKVITGEEEE